MEIAKSDIVRSDAGRDRGKIFIVLAVEGEYLLLADGKGRRVEAPKRKKRRHVLLLQRTKAALPIRSNAARRSRTVSFAGHLPPTAARSNRTRRDNVWQNPT